MTAGETETGTGPSVSVGPRARTPGEPEGARGRPRELTETPRPSTTSDVILQGLTYPSHHSLYKRRHLRGST